MIGRPTGGYKNDRFSGAEGGAEPSSTGCENFESNQDLLNICISENIMVKFYNQS